MKVAALGDIHAPKYFDLFKKSLEEFLKRKEGVSAFLLAGDLIDGGRYDQLDIIRELIRKVDLPTYSCFGNNEYQEYSDIVMKKLPEVVFLDDNCMKLKRIEDDVAIVGSRGVLDKPTYWQKKNWNDADEIYEKRRNKLNELADMCQADMKILLIHYPPTLKIVKGENPRFTEQMGSNKLDPVIKKFNLVITAHAHKGKKLVEIDGIPVYNVSLPLNGGIRILEVKQKHGLEKYM
ncbi:MAG: metallophosphoesterase [Nitrososphaeria archaeon]|jgi:Icc-related predicted phosphoesterase